MYSTVDLYYIVVGVEPSFINFSSCDVVDIFIAVAEADIIDGGLERSFRDEGFAGVGSIAPFLVWEEGNGLSTWVICLYLLL